MKKLKKDMSIRIFPPLEMVDTQVSVPLSKSISTRSLIMAYLTPGVSTLPTDGISKCRDAEIMRYCLENFSKEINTGGAGTAMRFLTALYASLPTKEVVVTGNERMCQRPIGPLVDALKTLGAKIEYLDREGFPPLKIYGRKLTGGSVGLNADLSSQFVSALMMVAPLMENLLEIELTGDARYVSPYIKMTAEMMNRRGVAAEIEGYKILVPNTPYTKVVDDSEPDWSAAAFWYEIAALTSGFVNIEGLSSHAIQGDRVIADVFKRLGVSSEYTDEGVELSALPDLYARVDRDMSDMPDAVPSVVVTSALLGVPFRLTGVKSLKFKESHRLDALRRELLKFGFLLESEEESGADAIAWEGKRVPVTQIPVIETYDDHRIAMAFAPTAVFFPGIVIKNSQTAGKSYPEFWDQLKSAGFIIQSPEAPIPEEYLSEE